MDDEACCIYVKEVIHNMILRVMKACSLICGLEPGRRGLHRVRPYSHE